MGAVTFCTSFFGGGATVSFMMFGNPFTFPLMATAFVVGLCLILYGLSVWWAPYAYKFLVGIYKLLKEIDRREIEANQPTEDQPTKNREEPN
jgi:hypothetical protein